MGPSKSQNEMVAVHFIKTYIVGLLPAILKNARQPWWPKTDFNMK